MSVTMRIAAITFLAVAMSAGAAHANTTVPVTIDNFTFRPATLTIAPGTSVTWTNRDDIPHTVTGAGGQSPLHSGALDTGDTVSVTFDRPGTYQYFCSLHPMMRGSVVVK